MPTSPFLEAERDEKAKRGRIKAGGGTIYYGLPGCAVTGTGIATIPAFDTDQYTPFVVDTPVIVDQLAAEVTTLVAGKNFRMGMYRADADQQPIGAPLADSGNISTATTGVKTYTPATPIYLPRGRYLTVFNDSDDTFTALWRSYGLQSLDYYLLTTLGANPIARLTVGRAYAAFPTPGTKWTTVGSGASGPQTFVVARVSTP